MKVLIACEESGRVRDAFLAKGHDAWSCDIQDSAIKGPHIKGDVLNVLYQGWDLMIAHPPCTYLCNSGVSWLYYSEDNERVFPSNSKRWGLMKNAAQFFLELLRAPIPKIAIENPIPHGHAVYYIGKYDQIIQPFQFGHPERKATCLWLKNLPKLYPTRVVKLHADKRKAQRLHWLPPSPNRAKIRSRTFQGIARAMAEQWG